MEEGLFTLESDSISNIFKFDLKQYQLTSKEKKLLLKKYEQLQFISESQQNYDSAQSVIEIQANNHQLIEICQYHGKALLELFQFPHLMLTTNERGYITFVSGDDDTLEKAAKDYVELGLSLSLQDRGMNPFSASMEFRRSLFTDREESWPQALKNWDVFCLPIHTKEHMHASVGFMFPSKWPKEKIIPNLKAICKDIVQVVCAGDQPLNPLDNIGLLERLKQFDLTPRELEVAKYWILDYDYMQIGHLIGISRHTVRVLVSRINDKLNVNSKASMILKLLGLI